MTMSFTEALRNCFARKFCSTRGRASRSEYWWFVLFATVAGSVLQNVPVVGALLSLVLLCPHICVTARRLHDIGWSGWWQLMPLVLMIFGILSFAFDNSGTLCVASALGAIVFGLYFGLRRGTPPGVDNPYGGAPDSFSDLPDTASAPSTEGEFVLEEENGMLCPNCGKFFAAGDRFCGQCGHAYPQPPSCPSCGNRLNDDSRFCTKCGAKLKD
jgi:uncharacterized membrane protein YhaH (DUF805 family)